MIEKLYTVEEVAELASVTGRTIRNYLKSGRLIGRKIGGQWRFPESEVQRLLTGAAPEPATPASSPVIEEEPLQMEDTASVPIQDFPVSNITEQQNTHDYMQQQQYHPSPSVAFNTEPVYETIQVAEFSLHETAYYPPKPAPLPNNGAPSLRQTYPVEQQPQPSPNIVYNGTVAPPPYTYTVQPTGEVPLGAQQYSYPENNHSFSQHENIPPSSFPTIQHPENIPANYNENYGKTNYTPNINSTIDSVPPYQVPSPVYEQPAPVAMPPMQQNPYQDAVSHPSLQPQMYYSAPPQQAVAPPAPSIDVQTTHTQTSHALVEEPLHKEEPPTHTKENAVSPTPELSDVGKQVTRFVAEVHDCEQGPRICCIIDQHQTLPAAKTSSERLAEIARQESENGQLCQSFVEFDERYFVARYTLFGTSSFLARCLKLLG